MVKNGSQIRSRLSSGMPTPVSLTSISTEAPVASRCDLVTACSRACGPLEDGLSGVDEEVDDDLAEPAVFHHHRRHLVEVSNELGALEDLAAGERDRALDRSVDVDDGAALVGRGGRAREEAEVAGDVDDPPDRIAELAEELARALGRARIHVDAGARDEPVEHVEPEEDERGGVVDLVSDAGREGAERRQPIGLDEGRVRAACSPLTSASSPSIATTPPRSLRSG